MSSTGPSPGCVSGDQCLAVCGSKQARPCFKTLPLWLGVDLWPFLEGRRIGCETGPFLRGNNEIVDEGLSQWKGDLMTWFW